MIDRSEQPTIDPSDRQMPQRDFRRSWLYLPRIFPYVRRYSRLAVFSVLLMIVTALISLIEPWPLAILIDSVLGTRPIPELFRGLVGDSRTVLLVVIVVGGWLLTLVGYGITVLYEYVNTKLERHLALDFRSDLFEHAQRLSLSFHEMSPPGFLVARVIGEVDSMGTIPLTLPLVAQSFLTIVGMLWISFHIDPLLSLLSLTIMPFIYFSMGYYSKRIEPRVRRVKWLEWRSIAMCMEAIGMLRVIYTFGRERYEWTRFRRQGEIARDARIDTTVRQTLFSLAVDGATATGMAVVLGIGALHVIRGRITVGQLLVVIAYINAVYAPLRAIASSFATLQDDVVKLQLACEYLDLEPEIKDAPHARNIDRARGDVTFDHVHFAYSGRQRTLEDISFEGRAGEVLAVVGPTGAGKSTLVSLIPRLYEAQSGRILIDGIDINDMTLRSLREQVSLVLQEPILFSADIEQNIRYGRLDASMQEIKEAAAAADAHEFIMALPKKYRTQLGDRGVKLSGGERQRICIARAFLKDAPILILDEPTSSVDSKTETAILDALERLMVGRTTFLIAHRLSTVRRADRILALDHGRLVEQGTEKELLGRDGLYRALYRAQMGQVAGGNGKQQRPRSWVQPGSTGRTGTGDPSKAPISPGPAAGQPSAGAAIRPPGEDP
jgi:ATP-binding cassette subfamily B protein